ncbi:MAG TPA: NYN domain-containing protein [Candidatus Binatia bacterium]
MEVIIDGYNLIGSEHGLHGALEHKRNWLVGRLSAYQKIKRFDVTVVFDGWRSGQTGEASAKFDGISVIYSRLGEKADSVIVRLARERSAGAVVVSSDREIRNAVERSGAVAISADEFNRILRSLDRRDCVEDEEIRDSRSVKKGNPNRLSKSEHRRNEKLKKLRL